MRLFRRKPHTITHDEAREVIELLHAISDDMIALRWDIQDMKREVARLGPIQATAEQTGRYLAEQEWHRNAATAGARWQELDEDTFKKADPPVETEQERVQRLRKKWEQAREKRGHTE